ncbi:hypothetical protein PLESTB_001063700 [Pleodorina starrii]|uniref:Uncharacterized protein n=1 Tax=Pleodorina starrii TaxID=330485 RepID=A0A9W6BQ12_9CHLO|nr:hypothetical protein PLESTM_001281600 [Pleodorina starrii]GLC56094.1 hypothetical protein PLESTB_001063700 [Pleodorina starrii]GLC64078.1 hypothetical protein PLESTF_000115800 [Pleodorina starrii]
MAERPPTKGLAVLGGAPPTRSGSLPTAGRLSTAATQRGPTAKTAGGSLLDPMAQDLIVRLRLKFGDAAATLSGQEIISKEVLHYLAVAPTRPPQTKEADMTLLEDRIRAKLLGGTPSKNGLAAAKRSEGSDEWLAIFKYDMAIGSLKERLEGEAARARQAALKAQLEAQMAENERLRQLEREKEEAYFRQEQAALRKAEEQEEARRRLRTEIMLKVKDERTTQMSDRRARREAELARKRAEESLEAARTAYDTAEELRREEEHRIQAKLTLRDYLSENEVNKALKEEAKKQQWVEDAAFQRKWEAILNKQEADRQEQMDRIKRHQSKLQEAADRQGETRRRWLDTPLVERYFKQREDERAAEEERRLQHQKETARHITAAVGEQLKEREAARLRMKQEEEAYAASLAAKIRAAEEVELARKRAMQERKQRFRAEIEDQLRDVAARRRDAAKPMTETERAFNQRTLQQVAVWQSTGKLPVSLPGLTSPSTASSLAALSASTAR